LPQRQTFVKVRLIGRSVIGQKAQPPGAVDRLITWKRDEQRLPIAADLFESERFTVASAALYGALERDVTTTGQLHGSRRKVLCRALIPNLQRDPFACVDGSAGVLARRLARDYSVGSRGYCGATSS